MFLTHVEACTSESTAAAKKNLVPCNVLEEDFKGDIRRWVMAGMRQFDMYRLISARVKPLQLDDTGRQKVGKCRGVVMCVVRFGLRLHGEGGVLPRVGEHPPPTADGIYAGTLRYQCEVVQVTAGICGPALWREIDAPLRESPFCLNSFTIFIVYSFPRVVCCILPFSLSLCGFAPRCRSWYAYSTPYLFLDRHLLLSPSEDPFL